MLERSSCPRPGIELVVTAKMGFLDFVKSDEKRASSPEDDGVQRFQSGPVEVEEVGDELHRGMKPRQLSEYNKKFHGKDSFG